MHDSWVVLSGSESGYQAKRNEYGPAHTEEQFDTAPLKAMGQLFLQVDETNPGDYRALIRTTVSIWQYIPTRDGRVTRVQT